MESVLLFPKVNLRNHDTLFLLKIIGFDDTIIVIFVFEKKLIHWERINNI